MTDRMTKGYYDRVCDNLICENLCRLEKENRELKERAEKAEAALAESAPTKPLHGDVMCEICGAIGHLKPMPKKVSRETLAPFQNELWENCMGHVDAWHFVGRLAKELGVEVEEVEP